MCRLEPRPGAICQVQAQLIFREAAVSFGGVLKASELMLRHMLMAREQRVMTWQPELGAHAVIPQCGDAQTPSFQELHTFLASQEGTEAFLSSSQPGQVNPECCFGEWVKPQSVRRSSGVGAVVPASMLELCIFVGCFFDKSG